MTNHIAKRNRLQGKFNFKFKDWRFETDGMEDVPRIPQKDGQPRRISRDLLRSKGLPAEDLADWSEAESPAPH